ncbi:hypothetical protein CUTA107171_22580 [Cupriavidus taiwanensis]
MVFRRLATVSASLPRTVYDGNKVAILRVLKHAGELPCPPEFETVLVLVPDALESLVMLCSHAFISH